MWLVTRQQTNLVQSSNVLRQDAEALLRVKQAHTLRLQYDQTAANKVRCMMLQQPVHCFQRPCDDSMGSTAGQQVTLHNGSLHSAAVQCTLQPPQALPRWLQHLRLANIMQHTEQLALAANMYTSGLAVPASLWHDCCTLSTTAEATAQQ
jgi:hypothetical protein